MTRRVSAVGPQGGESASPLSARERLAHRRAQVALARRPGWLGTGRRWEAFVAPGCPCCAAVDSAQRSHMNRASA